MSSRERPILFSAPMVQALLAGTKTQTRRIVKPRPVDGWKPVVGYYYPTKVDQHGEEYPGGEIYGASDEECGYICRYGAPGDRLWVRENGWQRPDRTPQMLREGADTWAPYYYDADGYTDVDRDQFKAWGFRRRPSIHMPRWGSRINLEIIGVRVERVQDISEDDAKAEGVFEWAKSTCAKDNCCELDALGYFELLWSEINGRESWDNNPWVWVVEFK